MADDEKLIGYPGVHELTGLEVPTIRVYLKRTRARIAEELPVRDQDFPMPDETYGQSPTWKPSTIERWLANRPGRGRRSATNARAIPGRVVIGDDQQDSE